MREPEANDRPTPAAADQVAQSPVGIERRPASATVVDDDVVRIPPARAQPTETPDPRPVLRVDEARRRALRPWAIAGAGAVIAAVAAVGLVASPVFDADTIAVSGDRHLDEAHVLRVAGVDHDTNVFRLDEGSIERRLTRDPWILRATVTADLPSTIRIDVVERLPVALATTQAGRSLVAEDGTVLGRAAVATSYPEIRAAESFTVVGDAPAGGATAAVGETSGGETIEAEPVDLKVLRTGAKVAGSLAIVLRTQVQAIEVSTDGTVTLELDSGTPVAFGHANDLEAKSQALTAILSYARGQPTPLVSIDVSTPAAPTARFVGVAASASVLAEKPATHGDRGTDPGESPSPSSSASASP